MCGFECNNVLIISDRWIYDFIIRKIVLCSMIPSKFILCMIFWSWSKIIVHMHALFQFHIRYNNKISSLIVFINKKYKFASTRIILNHFSKFLLNDCKDKHLSKIFRTNSRRKCTYSMSQKCFDFMQQIIYNMPIINVKIGSYNIPTLANFQ